MARLSARFDVPNLILRVISAAVILPLAAGLIWAGGWYFSVFVALIGAAMGWEFSRLCGKEWEFGALLIATLCPLPVVLALHGLFVAALWGAAGCAAVALTAMWRRHGETALLIGGGLYLAVATLSIAWLRLVPESGILVVFWVVAVVVGTDVGAYFAGRMVGGPKLASRISPSKTWAGLVGGMVAAAACGWVTVRFATGAAPVALAVAGTGLAVVAQIGDLIESAVKRHFGVKDSGTMIPGHGGVLDRLDGYLTVAPAVLLMTVVVGRNPLEW